MIVNNLKMEEEMVNPMQEEMRITKEMMNNSKEESDQKRERQSSKKRVDSQNKKSTNIFGRQMQSAKSRESISLSDAE